MTKKTATKSAKPAAATGQYTKPRLRDKIKAKIMKGVKGGRAGQWSARKAQLVAAEYEKAGGGYAGDKAAGQKHLKQWGDEKWHTATGKKAIRGKKTSRYLPDKAWEELTPAEKKATETKKQAGAKKGHQFVKNTPKAAAAGKRARSTTLRSVRKTK